MKPGEILFPDPHPGKFRSSPRKFSEILYLPRSKFLDPSLELDSKVLNGCPNSMYLYDNAKTFNTYKTFESWLFNSAIVITFRPFKNFE